MPKAAEILVKVYPQIKDFNAEGMTAEQIHYFLGEDAGVAYFQYQTLIGA